MAEKLDGIQVAILVADGFEQVELEKPRKVLEEAGAETKIVSSAGKQAKSWATTDWGSKFKTDITLDDADANDFDALVLPGGVINPDKLRTTPGAIEFVNAFFDSGKPVAAICHGPWSVLEAGEVRGRKITSWPSPKTDLKKAGAEWVDQEWWTATW